MAGAASSPPSNIQASEAVTKPACDSPLAGGHPAQHFFQGSPIGSALLA